MNASPAHDQIRAELAAGWAALGNDAASALRNADAVLAQMPGNADGTLLRAAALRRQGQIEAAYRCLAPLMAPPPSAAIPWFEWGMILSAMGEDERAIEAYRQATRLAPNLAGAWRAMGDELIILGDNAQAGRAYAHAARAANRNPALAQAAADLCNTKEAAAAAALRGYAALHPTDPAALHLLSEAELRLGRLDAAEAALRRCLDAAPESAEARHTLGILFHLQAKHDKSAAFFADLVTRGPHNAGLRTLLALSLMHIGDLAGALPHCEWLIAGYRQHAKAWLMYAHALKTIGREEDAAAAFRSCIKLAPAAFAAGAFQSLADIKTVRFDDQDIVTMQAALQRATPNSIDAAQLHYALGRAREQRAEWATSFSHYAAGARARRATISYDADSVSAFAAAAAAVFDRGFFAARQGAGCRSAAPILIVGMPRSGSTLVEQILASHSAVEGTSELEAIGHIARDLRAGKDLACLPDAIAGLQPSVFAQLGERYLDETAPFRRDGKPHFTDKMPDNFLHAGLIALILPNARIVDVRRGAMAAGWAGFKQFFQPRQTGQDYTYDLTEIGRYRRDYVSLMAHWQAVLPGRIHLVRYERLVEHTDSEIRALLDFCGLPFEPACLRFWETARSVRTPSAQQVRQPIFREGLDAWRHYAPWLGSLKEALGDLAED